MRKHTFSTLAVATLVVFAAIAVPAAAADGDQITHGADAIPSWHVEVNDGSLDSLASWANSSEDRELLRTHNASNYALVRAPSASMGKTLLSGILGSALEGKSYVQSIRPNLQHSLAEPVTLQNQMNVATPGRLTQIKASLGGLGSSSWSPAGIAYAEDANTSTMADVRGVLGVDNVSATGADSTIAVIDSGVNTADGQVFGNGSLGSDLRIDEASKDFLDNETVADEGIDAVQDPNGHGTHVAATAAANHSNASHDGIAPNANILALRALDAEGSGSAADIAAAIRYAADHDADVMILSLGSPFYDAQLTDALEYAQEQNVTAIGIAAGNSRQTTRFLASPADAPLDGVAAITATNTTSNATAASAYFANVGEDPAVDGSFGKTAGQDVDVGGPGMKITAMTPTTSGGVESTTLSGTSMANPAVISVAALGVETGEAWVGDSSAFVQALRDTARPMPNAAAIEVGAGMAAADRLLSNTTRGNQVAAMDPEASARDTFWRGLSNSAPWFHFETIDRLGV